MSRSRRLLAGASVMLAAMAASAQPLPELLEEALTHPRIVAREHDVASAEAALGAETARYFGGGEIAADLNHFDDRRIVGPFVPYDFAALPADRQFTRYGLRYSLPVDLFGAIAAARDRARGDLAAARLVRRQTRLLNLHQVATAYAELQALALRETALAKRGAALDRTQTRVRTQIELGQASRLDGRMVTSEIAAHRADLARLEGAIAAARARLSEALGRDARVVSAGIAVPAWTGAEAEETLPARLAARRADSTRAEATAARRELLPRLSLTAEASRFDGGGEQPESWRLGVQASVPLDLTSHRRRTASQWRGEAAAADARAAEREARSRIRALESAYRAAVADAEALAEEVAQRRDVVELAAEKHRLGAMPLEDLLRHQRDWLEAEVRVGQARAAALSAWSGLQVLRGIDPRAYIDAVGAAAERPQTPNG